MKQTDRKMTLPIKRVAITQRVIEDHGRGERYDVLDQAWTSFVADCGLEIHPLPNRIGNAEAYLRAYEIEAIILSGGGNISPYWETHSGASPDVPAEMSDLATERDELERQLLIASIEHKWPVIGVCRGMQFINLFYGGRLWPVKEHAGTNHILERREPGFPCDDRVNSYHNYGIPLDGLGDGLSVLATADDHVEAFAHRNNPHLGIMWHPERNKPWSKRDATLFRDFLVTGEKPWSKPTT
jgi:gamma-glutamyl-gamma-aminobutyrate hydrolase PuuD